MFFDDINIQHQLRKEKEKHPDLMAEINRLLQQAALQDEDILNRLLETDPADKQTFEMDESELKNIFTFSQIRNTCIAYRLRFLDSKHFRKEFPYDAISKIKEFETKHNVKVKRFKIIAPSGAFDLKDVHEDPLLFAQLSPKHYLLLHQWGNDLKWYRRWLYLPIRNIYSYFYSIIALAALVAFSIPFSWLQVKPDNEIYMRMWFTMHCTIGFFFFILFLGATTNASFSSMSWKSKYYNE